MLQTLFKKEIFTVVLLNPIFKAAENTQGLGTRTWEFSGNGDGCGGGSSFKTELTFSACENFEYICRDGSCVNMTVRCDGVEDCDDKSDEMGCMKVYTAPSYSKFISPPALNQESQPKMDVHLSVVVHSILSIKELDQLIYISYDLNMEWFDPRLEYHDIKPNIDLNVLSLREMESIWVPVLNFHNTRSHLKTQMDRNVITKIFPSENFTYERADMSEVNNKYFFKGSENTIFMSRSYDTYFLCEYNMAYYPFDTQICTMDIALNVIQIPFCQLQVESLVYKGPTDLVQYFVRSRHMVLVNIDESKGVRVYIVLGRRLLSNILTVYLPTILLNLTGHCTTYFKPFFFEVSCTLYNVIV